MTICTICTAALCRDVGILPTAQVNYSIVLAACSSELACDSVRADISPLIMPSNFAVPGATAKFKRSSTYGKAD